jgi:crotonobetainyl-CoA:carnitine CoA-transferase CaiB-like acyl-CoA transferase
MQREAPKAAPLLGQNNEEIYCGRLGYTKRDLTRLKEAGVI